MVGVCSCVPLPSLFSFHFRSTFHLFTLLFWVIDIWLCNVDAKFPSILHKKKNYFFYFTHPFLQNTHISPFILHNYSIKYSFFYNFLLFPHSLPLFLTDPTLPTITPHLATIITHPTTIIKESQPIQSGQNNPSTRKPIQSS